MFDSKEVLLMNFIRKFLMSGLAVFVFCFYNSFIYGFNTDQNSYLQLNFNKAAQKVKGAVANITATRLIKSQNGITQNQNGLNFARPFNPRKPYANKIGSGIIIDPRGYILTNYHVVNDAFDIHVTLPGLYPASIPAHFFRAQIIKVDITRDLAVIKIACNKPLPIATLGNSEKLQLGDWILAFGSPFGFDQTISAGIISAKNRSLIIEGRAYYKLLQTDASINQGNSGGPLVNMDGDVIAINTAIYSPNGSFSGLGFAMPINEALPLVSAATGKPSQSASKPWFDPKLAARAFSSPIMRIQNALPGVHFRTPFGVAQQFTQNVAFCPRGNTTPQIQTQRRCISPRRNWYYWYPKFFNKAAYSPPNANQVIFVAGESPGAGWLGTYLSPSVGKEGVVVTNVEANSPAESAGIETGDVIIGINGKEIIDIASFDDMITLMKPGDRIKMVLINQGKKKRIYVRLGTMP